MMFQLTFSQLPIHAAFVTIISLDDKDGCQGRSCLVLNELSLGHVMDTIPSLLPCTGTASFAPTISLRYLFALEAELATYFLLSF